MLTPADLSNLQQAEALDIFSRAYRFAELPEMAKPEVWMDFLSTNAGQLFLQRMRQDDPDTAEWQAERWTVAKSIAIRFNYLKKGGYRDDQLD